MLPFLSPPGSHRPPALAAVNVDPHLGEQTDAAPRVAAADGGELCQVTERDAHADDPDRERPADCECTPTIDDASGEEIGALPCWPCAWEGFETVNPAFPGLEE